MDLSEERVSIPSSPFIAYRLDQSLGDAEMLDVQPFGTKDAVLPITSVVDSDIMEVLVVSLLNASVGCDV